MREIALLVLAAAAGASAAHISDKRLHNEAIQIPGTHLDLLVKKNVVDFPEGPIGQWWSYGLQFEVELRGILHLFDEPDKFAIAGAQRLDLPPAAAGHTRHEEQDRGER